MKASLIDIYYWWMSYCTILPYPNSCIKHDLFVFYRNNLWFMEKGKENSEFHLTFILAILGLVHTILISISLIDLSLSCHVLFPQQGSVGKMTQLSWSESCVSSHHSHQINHHNPPSCLSCRCWRGLGPRRGEHCLLPQEMWRWHAQSIHGLRPDVDCRFGLLL